MGKTLRFSKSQRLVSNGQIKVVLDQRRRLADGVLVLYVAPNPCGCARLGVSVGRASGGAVARNRIKRLLRETFRLSQNQIPAHMDYVLMMAPSGRRRPGQPRAGQNKKVAGLTLKQVQDSFLRMVRRLPQAREEKV